MLLQGVSPSCGASAEKGGGVEEEEEEERKRKKNRKKMRVNHRLWRDVARSKELRNKQKKKLIRKELTVSSIKLLPAKRKSRFLKQSGKYRCSRTMLSGGIESEKYQAYLVLSFIFSSLLPIFVSLSSRSVTMAASIELKLMFVTNK